MAAAAAAAAFLSMRGASENVSKPQPTEPDERGDLYRFGSRSLSLVVGERGRGAGGGGRVAGVETVVRVRCEESTEPRSETEKREERRRLVDGTRSETKQRERMWRERERGEEGEANAEQEEARQDGREEEPRPVCASASESD